MLHGRRLDHALEHVYGSRYALVHAVAKRARQITLWLTADPAELRAEAAPPPMAGETVSRDPVALAEAEILDGEVIVHWDPDGRLDEQEIPDATVLETDPLLLEGLEGEEEDEGELEEEAETLTPALSQAIEGAPDAELAVEDTDEVSEEDIEEAEEELGGDEIDEEIEEIPLDEVDEGDNEDEPED
jgi:DNA-directed RNA polymerase subunit K/omega